MRGGPAKPLGRAQPPPTKGFTSNLNVQTTQLSKGLAPAFCYCPVLSPEALHQKLEQAAQSESPWASGADKKPQRSVTQGRRPLLIAVCSIHIHVPLTSLKTASLGRGLAGTSPQTKRKANKEGWLISTGSFPCSLALESSPQWPQLRLGFCPPQEPLGKGKSCSVPLS